MGDVGNLSVCHFSVVHGQALSCIRDLSAALGSAGYPGGTDPCCGGGHLSTESWDAAGVGFWQGSRDLLFELGGRMGQWQRTNLGIRLQGDLAGERAPQDLRGGARLL